MKGNNLDPGQSGLPKKLDPAAEARSYAAAAMVPSAVLTGKHGCECVSIMLEFPKRTYLVDNMTVVPESVRIIRSAIRAFVRDVLNECV